MLTLMPTIVSADIAPALISEEESGRGGREDAAVPTTTVAALYKMQSSKVRRYLGFRLGNTEDGADAAQDVFLKLWRHECRGALRAEARSYLFEATQSAIIDIQRRRAVRGYGCESVDPESIAAARAAPDDEMFWRQAITHFVNSVKALPHLTGEVFLLSLEGMASVQIARVLKISQRTAERHLMRAKANLRECMEDYL